MRRDADTAVIEPRKGRREAALPASAVLIFTPQDLELFFRCFPLRPPKTHTICLAGVYAGSARGVELAVAGPALGAPQAVMVIERLIALGVRNVVAVGWCGSLQEDVRIGDLVVPSSAVSEEGTSAHYPLSEGVVPTASPGLAEPLKGLLRARGARVHEGSVWSTDAPFRETVGKVKVHQERGILAVDMETSALFTLASFRAIRMAVALVVSDDLSSLQWVHGFREPAFKKSRELLAAATMEAVCSSIDLMTGE